MEIKTNRVMEINDLISQFMNADFDGDTEIALAVHSKQAKKDFDHMFIKNILEFDHKDDLLIDYEHESIYSSYMLSKIAIDNKGFVEEEGESIIIHTKNELNDLKSINADFYVTFFNAIKKGGRLLKVSTEEGIKEFTVFEILINSILGLLSDEDQNILSKDDKVFMLKIDNYLTKKELNNFTYKFYKLLQSIGKEKEFWDRIHVFNKFLLEAGTRINESIATFEFSDFVVKDEKIKKFKEKLIQNEPFLAFHQNMILFNDYILPNVKKNKESILTTLFESGARLKSVQLLKAASNSGIPTTITGEAIPLNIKNSLLDTLTPIEYFRTGDSARLALQQRQDSIPKGGELQRKFFFTTGVVKQDKDVEDCRDFTGNFKPFEITVRNKKYLKVLKHRYYIDPETNEEFVINGDEVHLIGKKIWLRTPITCQLDGYKVCKKCLGNKRPTTTHLGAPTGQLLSEAILQAVLRAHHFGGVFLANIDNDVTEALKIIELVETTEKYTIIKLKDDKEYQEKIEVIKNYLNRQYEEGSLEISYENDLMYIIVHKMPKSEDAVKILSAATSLIDKSCTIDNFDEMINDKFEKIVEISNGNGIFNIYFEIVMSLLFYDDDDLLYRYSDKLPTKQMALKTVINNIDPKLNMFYSFSNAAIEKIFTKKIVKEADHMYNDLIDFYK